MVHCFTDLVHGGCIISEHLHGKLGHYIIEDDIQQSEDKLFKRNAAGDLRSVSRSSHLTNYSFMKLLLGLSIDEVINPNSQPVKDLVLNI